MKLHATAQELVKMSGGRLKLGEVKRKLKAGADDIATLKAKSPHQSWAECAKVVCFGAAKPKPKLPDPAPVPKAAPKPPPPPATRPAPVPEKPEKPKVEKPSVESKPEAKPEAKPEDKPE